MRKYELALSSTYVPSWTVVDAIRELYQNALDEQTLNPANKVRVNYDHEDRLVISNTQSVLDISTLLLGSTTKQDEGATIGQFGEGYKLAALVLLRLGKTMEIHNLGKAEIWRPRFVNSKRYGAPILTFFVEDIENTPDIAAPLLSFIIDGITPEEYSEIVKSNLHLQPPITNFHTSARGKILFDKKYQGNVYVNGLFICNDSELLYGYDIKPAYLDINRDRHLVSNFDLLWTTSQMITESTGMLSDILSTNSRDALYASAHITTEMADTLYREFINLHGEMAVPVTTQEEMQLVPPGYTPIIVSLAYMSVLKRSKLYTLPEPDSGSLVERMNLWYTQARPYLPNIMCDRFEALLSELTKVMAK